MKKISSAIFIAAFLALISCKNNVGGDDKKDNAASIFYQSIINLGNGFIEVFNAFSGLVADAFSKADPKKSDVKTYFDSITKTLKETKTKLEDISKEKTGGEKTPAVEGIAEVVKTVGEWLDGLIKAAESGGKAAESGGAESIGNVAAGGGGANANANAVKGIAGAMKGIVEAARKVEGVKFEPAAAADDKEKVKAVVEWLDGLIKAAESGGKAAADGGGDKIGNVNAGAGANAAAAAVKGIAGAMKGIVEAARKVDGVKFEPAAAAEADNKKAGKLFGTNAAAEAEDAKDAAAAVGAVSGEQILSAIVAAAGSSDQTGKAAGQAKNAIEAAIGAAGANAEFGNDMKKKNDQIAAALVLRGVAKDGKFAAADANDKEKVKAVVESAVVKTC